MIRPWLHIRYAVALIVGTLFGTFAAAPAAQSYVYWSNRVVSGTIGRADLDGSAVNNAFINGLAVPWGVAVDAAHLYWVNADGKIGRANLDGSDNLPGFFPATYPGAGVAVDGAHLYWTWDISPGWIGRANLNGTSPNQNFVPTATYPTGVAVDGSHVYWTNYDTNGSIGRANLDGTIPDQNFINGANRPCGLAVDATHIYWSNRGAGTIGRAKIDGSSPNQSFVAGIPDPCGLALDNTYVYWTNSSGTVGRANLDGSSPNNNFITDLNNPLGVAVDVLPKAVLTALRETNSVFAVARASTPLAGRTAKRRRVGTVFSFRLDRAATVRIAVQYKAPGRRSGGTCKPPASTLRHKPRCTRTVTVATLSRMGHIGANSVPFSGRIRGKALRPRRYVAVFSALNAAGASLPRSLAFTIVKR